MSDRKPTPGPHEVVPWVWLRLGVFIGMFLSGLSSFIWFMMVVHNATDTWQQFWVVFLGALALLIAVIGARGMRDMAAGDPWEVLMCIDC